MNEETLSNFEALFCSAIGASNNVLVFCVSDQGIPLLRHRGRILVGGQRSGVPYTRSEALSEGQWEALERALEESGADVTIQ